MHAVEKRLRTDDRLQTLTFESDASECAASAGRLSSWTASRRSRHVSAHQSSSSACSRATTTQSPTRSRSTRNADAASPSDTVAAAGEPAYSRRGYRRLAPRTAGGALRACAVGACMRGRFEGFTRLPACSGKVFFTTMALLQHDV